ncbi:hypothetical protein B0H21DRAFT_58678 [Amylocystis lapponica]|nr:hypothetical protein B0H21DRAFT_58678 [Amylocystis lapponica]
MQQSQPQHSSDADLLRISEEIPSTPPSDTRSHGRRSAIPLARLIVPLAVLSSVAIFPYLLLRTRISTLQRKLADLSTENERLREAVAPLSSHTTVLHHQHKHLVGQLGEIRGSLERLRGWGEQRDAARTEADGRFEHELRDIRLDLERLAMDTMRKDRARTAAVEVCRSELQTLLRERMWTREHLSALRGLGSPLADVAAFMHEVEVQQGYTPRGDDGRGIEKIRQVALKMQSLPPSPDGAKDSKTGSASDAT